MKDVCIVGGGLVGGVFGIALAKLGMNAAIVDCGSKKMSINSIDNRTTAISLASKLMFDELGLWNEIAPYAEPILDIKVYEIGSPWSIHFDHNMIGKEPMGYIVENQFIKQAILNCTQDCQMLDWYDETSIKNKKITASMIELSLANGLDIHSSLLVGAEGRLSSLRDAANIKNYQIPYNQKALVFSVAHDEPHQGIAWEAFHPNGPMAFLPLKDCPKTNRYRSGVVWTLPTKYADCSITKENEYIEEELNELFGFLGKLEIIGEKRIYPLMAQMADRMVDERLVIIGDAAHVYHPVAGQGVNVGWRDAFSLAKILQQTKQLGIDIGSQKILNDYQRKRRLDIYSVFAMTHGMVRLFSNNSSILYFLRNGGLGVVNQIAPVKRFFMRKAMGF